MSATVSEVDQRLSEALARIAELEEIVKKLTRAQPAAAPTPSTKPPSSRRKQPDARVWTVIAAAVAVVCPEPHRIVGIQMVGLPPMNLWAFEGRRAIFYSHHVRRG